MTDRHGHDEGGFSPLKAALYAFRHTNGRPNELLVPLADLRPGMVGVDLGSGPGQAVVAAARAQPLAEVIGVEPAANLRRFARARARLGRVAGRVEFRAGSAESLPLPDHSADVVWAGNTLHHWADVDRGLLEVVRVLKPGGRFLAADEDPHHPDFPKDDPHPDWPSVDYERVRSVLQASGATVTIGQAMAVDTPVVLVDARTAPR